MWMVACRASPVAYLYCESGGPDRQAELAKLRFEQDEKISQRKAQALSVLWIKLQEVPVQGNRTTHSYGRCRQRMAG